MVDVLRGVKRPLEICRELDINPVFISRLKAEFLEIAPTIFEPDECNSDDQARIWELKCLLGHKALQVFSLRPRTAERSHLNQC